VGGAEVNIEEIMAIKNITEETINPKIEFSVNHQGNIERYQQRVNENMYRIINTLSNYLL
jgi:hypothetical protein